MKRVVSEISAVWTADGRISPIRFTWEGQVIQVVDRGRDWRDEEGYHVLCRGASSGVFELVLGPHGEWTGSTAGAMGGVAL